MILWDGCNLCKLWRRASYLGLFFIVYRLCNLLLRERYKWNFTSSIEFGNSPSLSFIGHTAAEHPKLRWMETRRRLSMECVSPTSSSCVNPNAFSDCDFSTSSFQTQPSLPYGWSYLPAALSPVAPTDPGQLTHALRRSFSAHVRPAGRSHIIRSVYFTS